MVKLTTNALRASWPGKDRWLSDGGPRGAGRLVARITREDVAFYYQYFAAGGRKRFLVLGCYDTQGVRGLSLPKARDRAAELSALYRSGATDLHAHFERERAAEERARRAEDEAARRAQEEAQRSTLRQLLEAYVAHLERLGKQSAPDVRNIFENHVLSAAPDLTARKAAELSADDFVELIGRLAENGKGRTAAKLRSYLRAAYSLALRSWMDPSAPMTLRAFGIRTNPIASIAALPQFNRARERVLSGPELGAFLRRLDATYPGPQRDVVKLCLLLGGQRPTQLLRARAADVDLDTGIIVLHDSKGARRQPRRHVVPLSKAASAIFERRLVEVNRIPGSPLFSTDGRRTLHTGTLAALIAEISADISRRRRLEKVSRCATCAGRRRRCWQASECQAT
ncbi:MAG: tyrosine-type recombinase/integrase [Steroidobacteraceae bacterium]